jgi:hypothetical protein
MNVKRTPRAGLMPIIDYPDWLPLAQRPAKT